MRIKFWGVRGSFPVAAPQCMRYGGNTPCTEVETGHETIILDAGTGIRAAGVELRRRKIRRIHLLFSHFHWDHIQGLPFFAPLYDADTEISFYALRRQRGSLQDILSGQQRPPFSSKPLAGSKARLRFVELEEGQTVHIGGAALCTRPLNHPGLASGYRLEHGGAAMAYISDVDLSSNQLLGLERREDVPPDPRQRLLRLQDSVSRLADGVDALICDTFFFGDEYIPGWGHSRLRDALSLGLSSQSRCVVAFHHKPERSDAELDRTLTRFRPQLEGRLELVAAAEGNTLHL